MSNPSEGVVCRAVIDRHDVMTNQIAAVVREVFGLDEKTKSVVQTVNQIVQSHTNGLVETISNEFAKK